ncbi:hypothetical protein BKA70DRAFT_1373963 [Coprinopsis sp. MPI-PUGE-AT-0042]|nr:hypothetical protein BKA70DRAFT_1373963 [Coprinopsis sp. MPI-PUGE-AT-0042]
MMEPRLMQWYQAGQARIDKLSLQDYYKELAVIMLEENWDHKLREEILSARQGNREFLSLSPEALKAQLEANLNADLKLDLLNDPVKEKDLAKWSSLVKTRDDKLRAEGEKIKKAIASNDALKAQRRDERRTLASRLTSPPPKTASSRPPNPPSNQPSSGGSASSANSPSGRVPALTPNERELLNKHSGCTRCRKFYAGHHAVDCPMTAANEWPDAATYKTLTPAMATAAAAAATPSRTTVAFVISGMWTHPTRMSPHPPPPPSPPSPFSIPHLYAPVQLTGPSITSFPLPVGAMLDIGCPPVVISDELVSKLGLRRFALPAVENNLLSLSESPLECREYVKLGVTSGDGAWKSGVIKAKVNVGLAVPLILGMAFLATEHIVIDTRGRTAVDSRTGYDLLNPKKPEQVWLPERVTPPPTPKKPKKEKPMTLEQTPPPKLDGTLLPPSIMAMVREHIETIAFQQMLAKKDEALKKEYADRFPLRLPDTTDDVPDHIYHRIRLRLTTSLLTAAKGRFLGSWI